MPFEIFPYNVTKHEQISKINTYTAHWSNKNTPQSQANLVQPLLLFQLHERTSGTVNVFTLHILLFSPCPFTVFTLPTVVFHLAPSAVFHFVPPLFSPYPSAVFHLAHHVTKVAMIIEFTCFIIKGR